MTERQGWSGRGTVTRRSGPAAPGQGPAGPPRDRRPPPAGAQNAGAQNAGAQNADDAAGSRAARRIDPRFARRWTQVRREAGRRRLRMVAVGTAAVLAVGVAVGSLYSPAFELRHVRVTAAGTVSRPEVLAVSGLSRPRPLIEVDTAAVARRLDGVAALGGARVRRSWPSSLQIQVSVRTALAVVARSASEPGVAPAWATVDATGRILADLATAPSGLPVVAGVGPVPAPGGWLTGSAGPAAPPLRVGQNGTGPGLSLADLNAAVDSPTTPSGPAAALAILAALPASVRTEVLNVTVAGGGQLTMAVLPAQVAAGSIPVVLGDGSQLAAKLTAVVALLGQADLSGVTRINVVVPDRPAVLTARQTAGILSTLAGG
jgi:hypothetical protein